MFYCVIKLTFHALWGKPIVWLFCCHNLAVALEN